MKYYQLRENPEANCITLEVVYDFMAPLPFSDYSDIESALAANPDLDWLEVTPELREQYEIQGDILYTTENNE